MLHAGVVAGYSEQRFRWLRRWRYWLIAAAAVAWLPVFLLLIWKLRIAVVANQQDFYWLPGFSATPFELWERPLLRVTFDFEYYARALRRLIAIMAAVGYSMSLRPLAAQAAAQPAATYRDYRRAVRRGVYSAMLLLALLPSLVADLARDAVVTPTGLDLGTIGYPMLLLVVDWFSQCEFIQWLLLRFRRGSFWAYVGLGMLLTALYYYADYYVPQTYHWGRLVVSPVYPVLMGAFLMLFSLATAWFWWRQTLALAPVRATELSVAAVWQHGISVTAEEQAEQRFRLSRRALYIAALLLALLGVAYLKVVQSGVLYDTDRYPNPDFTIPVVSTRGHLYYGSLVQGHDAYGYDVDDPQGVLASPAADDSNILIVIHGFNNGPRRARYKFDLAQSSARSDGFNGIVVGWSWDADTHHDPFSATGYSTGDSHAAQNGRMLAQFAVDYKRKHPRARLHVIGYSMGARVALEALLALHTDPRFAGSSVKLDTVHLLGASVDSEEVELGEKYGEAIAACAGAFYNYYSRQDVALGSFYWAKTTDKSLGETCIEHPQRKPPNYVSVDAAAELVSYDHEFNEEPDKAGQNHKCYLGIKDLSGKLVDDGALNLVVANIKLPEPLVAS